MRPARLVYGLAWSLLAAGALLIAGPARADEVHMKNGSVFKTTKIDKGEKVWQLTTELGVIEVKAADVDRVVEAPKIEPRPAPPKGAKGTEIQAETAQAKPPKDAKHR